LWCPDKLAVSTVFNSSAQTYRGYAGAELRGSRTAEGTTLFKIAPPRQIRQRLQIAAAFDKTQATLVETGQRVARPRQRAAGDSVSDAAEAPIFFAATAAKVARLPPQ
jgi:hypothetical protein